MVSNIPFGSYQPEWMDYLKTYSSIFGWNFRKVALPFALHLDFFFFRFFGLRGKKKIDYRDIGREHDRRLAKRKKKCFWWNMDIRCHSPFKRVLNLFLASLPNCYFLFGAENFAFIAFLACDRASSPGAPGRACSQAIAFPSTQLDGFMCKFCPLLHWPVDGEREFLSVSVCACEISKIKMRRKNARFFCQNCVKTFYAEIVKK